MSWMMRFEGSFGVMAKWLYITGMEFMGIVYEY